MSKGDKEPAKEPVRLPPYLARLEAESIQILREGVAAAQAPAILFSAGKDSTVLADLAVRAFWPSPPPMPLVHVDSTWDFSGVYDFRDRFARNNKFKLVAFVNEEARAEGINPFDHGSLYTTRMRTDALKMALDEGGYDVIFGGARRDEESTRAKERIFSVRQNHRWEPRKQRPELWNIYNTNLSKGQSVRVYPLSNWTEMDIWTYILLRRLDIAPLYYAAERDVIEREGQIIVVDDASRMKWRDGEKPVRKWVRFRTLGCWPVTGAMPSKAATIEEVFSETLDSRSSERTGRASDEGSLEAQKTEGYF